MTNKNKISTEIFISYVLKCCIYISTSFIVLGLLLNFIFEYKQYELSYNPSLIVLVDELLSGNITPEILIYCGLVLLMLAPVFRVIAAVIGFALERDKKFVFISLTVLFLLFAEIIYSINI